MNSCAESQLNEIGPCHGHENFEIMTFELIRPNMCVNNECTPPQSRSKCLIERLKAWRNVAVFVIRSKFVPSREARSSRFRRDGLTLQNSQGLPVPPARVSVQVPLI